MAGSINSNMFICARIIAGIGIGFINAIIPPWVNELSQAHDRGSTFSLVFVANYTGIVIAYWLNFGLRTSGEAFRWRFPLAFMAIPMIIVALTVFFLPESPRWLISHGGRQEAIDILRKLRGDLPYDDPKLLVEVEQLDAVIEASHHKRNNLINIVLGGRYSGQLHYGRRALMGMALQTIQQWTGILAIATWASVLFGLAGFGEYKSAWLGGLVNTFGIFGTAAAALVIDRLGRVKSLIVSFITQGICLIIVGVLIKVSEEKAASNQALATQLGTGAGAFVFIFLVCFTVFNIVPCWIYGSEIFPTGKHSPHSLTSLFFFANQRMTNALFNRNPIQGLWFHHLRLGHRLRHDHLRYPHHVEPPRLGHLHLLRGHERRLRPHHLPLLP
jgi:MFS family permease